MNFKNKKSWLKYLDLFVIGGLIYMMIELIYRGYTHWTMGIVGGLAFIEIGLINEFYSWDMYFEKQVIIGDLLVTFTEFIAGLILNVWLGLGIWDYSNLPFNIMGQICIPFMFLWLFLVAIAILVDDMLRYKLFGEEEPRYVSWIKTKLNTKD